MTNEELQEILRKHKAWLDGETGGEIANLRGTNLGDADLGGAYLRCADLSDANLRGAYLGGAYLYGANLRGAYLRGADLRGAYLGGAKDILSIGPGGSRGDMLYAVRWDDGLRIKVGCFWGTLAEFEAAVQSTHGDNQHGKYYRAVIAMLKEWDVNDAN